jgi:hypothetical protein
MVEFSPFGYFTGKAHIGRVQDLYAGDLSEVDTR